MTESDSNLLIPRGETRFISLNMEAPRTERSDFLRQVVQMDLEMIPGEGGTLKLTNPGDDVTLTLGRAARIVGGGGSLE